MDITGKVALVTGGASGIGHKIVEELLHNEIKGVCIADINVELAEKVIVELTEQFSSCTERVFFKKTDVCLQKECEEAFKATIKKFGHLDIVINNAGISNDVKYEKEINTNLTGVVNGTALALKYMATNQGGNGGVVISISSITAVVDIHTFPVYASTKVAVMNLMRAFGHSFHYENSGIRMIALLPGLTAPTRIGADPGLLFNDLDECSCILRKRPNQRPLAVARATLYIIANGESGSAWAIEGNKLYLVEVPDWTTYATVIQENIYKCDCTSTTST